MSGLDMRELTINKFDCNKTIIEYTNNRERALEELQIILMDKLLVSSNYKVHFIDLYGRGSSLGIFNNDLAENAKYGFYTCASNTDLTEFFKCMEEHINNTSTKIGPLKNLNEFNQRNNQKINETIIVFYDFPYGITSEYVDKIELISNQAKRCGLYIYIIKL